jgi:uroporphyrin-3 C-methyltransferase
MSALVKVTPPDEATKALLTPDTAQLIRSNLALQLQAARLALLRGEQAIFEQSLDDADALLAEYFEPGSTQVVSAQQTLTEIRDSMIVVTPPDISESLRLIRQFRTLSESAQ